MWDSTCGALPFLATYESVARGVEIHLPLGMSGQAKLAKIAELAFEFVQ